MKRTRIALSLLAAASIWVVGGCGDSDTSDGTDEKAPEPEQSIDSEGQPEGTAETGTDDENEVASAEQSTDVRNAPPEPEVERGGVPPGYRPDESGDAGTDGGGTPTGGGRGAGDATGAGRGSGAGPAGGTQTGPVVVFGADGHVRVRVGGVVREGDVYEIRGGRLTVVDEMGRWETLTVDGDLVVDDWGNRLPYRGTVPTAIPERTPLPSVALFDGTTMWLRVGNRTVEARVVDREGDNLTFVTEDGRRETLLVDAEIGIAVDDWGNTLAFASTE